MSYHTQRDASGRVISLLNEPDERPSYESRQSYTSASSHGYKRREIYPDTPDLARSHSYDSQASGHDSPLTPSSAYHEPLYLSAKEAPAHLYSSEAHQTTLPPISSFHKVAGTLETRAPMSPEVNRRRNSNPYGTLIRATSSSSSLEDFHFRSSVDARTTHVLPEPTVHSVESTEESPYSELPLMENSQPSREYRQEQIDASKKAAKSKNGNQKRYPCKDPSCDRTFTTSGHASRHAKIHEGLKPISCTFAGCPKRFTRQDNMKQHLETHRREKSRGITKQTRRPAGPARRQSASSRGDSVSRFSSPRITPPLLSPAIQAVVSPVLSESWVRPAAASRTPSGLDALAMVAATEQATVEQEEAYRHTEPFHHWRYAQY